MFVRFGIYRIRFQLINTCTIAASAAIGVILLLKIIVFDWRQSQINDDKRHHRNSLRLVQSLNRLSLDRINLSIIDRTPSYIYHDSKAISWQNNLYLHNYRLHYCKIDKNMGSAMQAIFCYIDEPTRMADFFWNQTWGPGLGSSRDCGISTSFGDLRQRFVAAAANIDFFQPSSNITHFAIIRHPLKRFVSAFIQVCQTLPQKNVCYDCLNLDCFLPKLYAHLRQHTNRAPLQRWPREHHFYPQSWYCDFDRHYHHYRLIRYERDENFAQEMIALFVNVNINQTIIEHVSKAMHTKTVTHETYQRAPTVLRQLMNSPVLLEYVYKIYYLDFVWFGYDLDIEIV